MHAAAAHYTLTHEVSKPANGKPASPGHKLEQTHPLLIVHFFHKLQMESEGLRLQGIFYQALWSSLKVLYKCL